MGTFHSATFKMSDTLLLGIQLCVVSPDRVTSQPMSEQVTLLHGRSYPISPLHLIALLLEI